MLSMTRINSVASDLFLLMGIVYYMSEYTKDVGINIVKSNIDNWRVMMTIFDLDKHFEGFL